MKGYVGFIVAALLGGLVVFFGQWYVAPRIRLTDVQATIKARDYDRAQRLLERYLRSNPEDPQAHLMLAGVLIRSGEPQKPLAHLKQVPDDTAWAIEARFQEGRLLRALGRATEAEASLLRCLRVDEQESPASMSDMARNATVELLMLYDFQRRRHESTVLYWTWYRRVPEAERVRALVMLLHMEFGATPPLEDVVAALNQYIATDPNDLHSRRSLGRTYVESGQDEQQGLELLKACVDQHPNDLASYVDYAWCLVEKGDLPAAESLLADLPRGAEKEAELWQVRGMYHELKEEWQDAARCFRQALSLEPWRRKPHGHLVNVMRRQNDARAAEEHEKRAKELFDSEERLASATHFMATNHVQPAAGSAFEIAELQERRGQIEEARAWYAETLRIDPMHEGARDGVARLGRPSVLR